MTKKICELFYTRRQKFLRIIINQGGAEYSYFPLGAQAQRDSPSLLASRELHSLCAAMYVAQYTNENKLLQN